MINQHQRFYRPHFPFERREFLQIRLRHENVWSDCPFYFCFENTLPSNLVSNCMILLLSYSFCFSAYRSLAYCKLSFSRFSTLTSIAIRHQGRLSLLYLFSRLIAGMARVNGLTRETVFGLFSCRDLFVFLENGLQITVWGWKTWNWIIQPLGIFFRNFARCFFSIIDNIKLQSV